MIRLSNFRVFGFISTKWWLALNWFVIRKKNLPKEHQKLPSKKPLVDLLAVILIPYDLITLSKTWCVDLSIYSIICCLLYCMNKFKFRKSDFVSFRRKKILNLMSSVCAPPPKYVKHPPLQNTQSHHTKYNTVAANCDTCVSRCANNMHPLNWGETNVISSVTHLQNFYEGGK